MKKPGFLNDMSRNKWYIATAVSCFVFPIGYIWLIVNTVIEFRKNISRNRAILYSGVGAAVFSLLYFLVFIILSDEDNSFLFDLWLMWLPQAIAAIYLFAVYAIHWNRSKNLSQCLMLVKDEHITSIDELAMITGATAKSVVRRVSRLIKKKYLDGADIDETHREILFRKSIWARQRVACDYCGAELTVNFGHTLICEYCGQALSVKRL